MDIYKLDVLEVPTNVAVKRIDADDEVYRTYDEKNEAIIKLIEECRERGQPVLVGTTSIERSEHLSALLKKRKITHNVLNARYHEQEAMIDGTRRAIRAPSAIRNQHDRPRAPPSSSAAWKSRHAHPKNELGGIVR